MSKSFNPGSPLDHLAAAVDKFKSDHPKTKQVKTGSIKRIKICYKTVCACWAVVHYGTEVLWQPGLGVIGCPKCKQELRRRK